MKINAKATKINEIEWHFPEVDECEYGADYPLLDFCPNEDPSKNRQAFAYIDLDRMIGWFATEDSTCSGKIPATADIIIRVDAGMTLDDMKDFAESFDLDSYSEDDEDVELEDSVEAYRSFSEIVQVLYDGKIENLIDSACGEKFLNKVEELRKRFESGEIADCEARLEAERAFNDLGCYGDTRISFFFDFEDLIDAIDEMREELEDEEDEE